MIGMAISAISSGLATMVSAWKANSSTTVASRPTIDHGFSRAVKASTAAVSPPWLAITRRRVSAPAASGITT